MYYKHEKRIETDEKMKVIKVFNQNGFKVTVCQVDLSDNQRKLVDQQMRKKLLEYISLTT